MFPLTPDRKRWCTIVSNGSGRDCLLPVDGQIEFLKGKR
jgi:hypothetical protein